MSNYIDSIEFVTEECCTCGMPFAMTADFKQRRLADRRLFYCPSGHAQHYTGKSQEQKLREKLDAERRRADAESGRASLLEDQRDQVARAHKRMRERVKNGVCPCCNRTFQNLLEHMRTQHPDFGRHQQLRALRDTYGLTQQAVAEEARVLTHHVSLYERQKPVARYAETALDEWMERNL